MSGWIKPHNAIEQQLFNDIRVAKSLYFVSSAFYNCGALPQLMLHCQQQRDLQVRIISTANGIRKFPFDLEQFLDEDYKSIRLLRDEHLCPKPFLHLVQDRGSCTIRFHRQIDQWDVNSVEFLQSLHEDHFHYSDKQNPDAQYQLAKLMDESYLLTLSELSTYQSSFRNATANVCA